MTTALTTTTNAPLTPAVAVRGAIASAFVRSEPDPSGWLSVVLADQCGVHLRVPNADKEGYLIAADLLLFRFQGIRKGDIQAAFYLLSAGLLGARPETYYGQITPAQIVDIFADYYDSETNKAVRDAMPDPRLKIPTAEETQARLEGEYRVQLELWQAHPAVEVQIAAHLAEVTAALEAQKITPLRAGQLRDEYAADLTAWRMRHRWPITWGQLAAVECGYLIRTYPALFDWEVAKVQAEKMPGEEMEYAHRNEFDRFRWESEKARATEMNKSIASVVATKLAVWNYLQSLLP